MRLACSSSGISNAVAMARAISGMSLGLTRTASPNSLAAPVISLRISTPRPSARAATYSLATRFMPSRSGVTSITSLAPYRGTSSCCGNDLYW